MVVFECLQLDYKNVDFLTAFAFVACDKSPS